MAEGRRDVNVAEAKHWLLAGDVSLERGAGCPPQRPRYAAAVGQIVVVGTDRRVHAFAERGDRPVHDADRPRADVEGVVEKLRHAPLPGEPRGRLVASHDSSAAGDQVRSARDCGRCPTGQGFRDATRDDSLLARCRAAHGSGGHPLGLERWHGARRRQVHRRRCASPAGRLSRHRPEWRRRVPSRVASGFDRSMSAVGPPAADARARMVRGETIRAPPTPTPARRPSA